MLITIDKMPFTLRDMTEVSYDLLEVYYLVFKQFNNFLLTQTAVLEDLFKSIKPSTHPFFIPPLLLNDLNKILSKEGEVYTQTGKKFSYSVKIEWDDIPEISTLKNQSGIFNAFCMPTIIPYHPSTPAFCSLAVNYEYLFNALADTCKDSYNSVGQYNKMVNVLNNPNGDKFETHCFSALRDLSQQKIVKDEWDLYSHFKKRLKGDFRFHNSLMQYKKGRHEDFTLVSQNSYRVKSIVTLYYLILFTFYLYPSKKYILFLEKSFVKKWTKLPQLLFMLNITVVAVD